MCVLERFMSACKPAGATSCIANGTHYFDYYLVSSYFLSSDNVTSINAC